MENKNIVEVDLVKIPYKKFSYFFLVFGFIFGLISSLFLFIFGSAFLEAADFPLPKTGWFIFSFFIFPILNAIVSLVLGIINLFFVNLTLKLIKGIRLNLIEID